MQKITLECDLIDVEIDWFMSDDIYANDQKICQSNKKHALWLLKDRLKDVLAERTEQRQFIELFCQKFNYDKIAVIEAHGSAYGLDWDFRDGDRLQSLQSMVDNLDGQYGCIILYCCNPGHNEVYTDESILMIPDKNVGSDLAMVVMDQEKPSYSLLAPYFGEEVVAYTIEYFIKKLQEMKGRRRRRPLYIEQVV